MMPEVDSGCKHAESGQPPGQPSDNRPPTHLATAPTAPDALDAMARGIADDEVRRVEEHAPTGPDALDERDLHAVLAAGLKSAGIAVVRECPFPRDPGGRVLPRDRERCDLVAMPEGAESVFDPVRERAEREAGENTLFAGELDRIADAARPPTACDPTQAAWIEVKTTGTHAYRDGVPGPNPVYADELVRGALADGLKLATAPDLGPRWVLSVVFTHDPDAIRKDLVTVAHRLLDHGVDTASPLTREVPIADRAGNTHAVLGLFEVRGEDASTER